VRQVRDKERKRDKGAKRYKDRDRDVEAECYIDRYLKRQIIKEIV
jgi:hypothetical protein